MQLNAVTGTECKIRKVHERENFRHDEKTMRKHDRLQTEGFFLFFSSLRAAEVQMFLKLQL